MGRPDELSQGISVQTGSLDRNANLWSVWSPHSPPSSNKRRCPLTSQIKISQCPTSSSHFNSPHGFCLSDLYFKDLPIGSLCSETSRPSPPNLFPPFPPFHLFRPSTLRQPFHVSAMELFRLLSPLSLPPLLPLPSLLPLPCLLPLPSLLPLPCLLPLLSLLPLRPSLPSLPSLLPLPNPLPSRASLPFSHRLSLPFSLLLCLLRPTNCRISSSLFSFCFSSSLHLSLFFQKIFTFLSTLPRYRLPSHVL